MSGMRSPIDLSEMDWNAGPEDWALLQAPTIRDERGALAVCQTGDCIPFTIARAYFIWGVPPGARRGGHAHRRLRQVIFVLSGSVRVTLRNGVKTERVSLSEPGLGLYTGTMIWRDLDRFTEGTVCLVLASEPYDPDEYIRSYGTWLEEVRESPSA